MNEQPIIITGGGGMLAAAIAREAARRGFNAIALRRDECDISIDTDRRDLFKLHRPSVLINCAAHTKVDLCETDRERALMINGHAPGLLATLCRQHGTRLVHYSTDFVFNGTKSGSYSEADPTAPINFYGESKLLGEQAIQHVFGKGSSGYLILRTAWLFGHPGNCFPRLMVEMAKSGKQLRVVSDQHGCPTSTDDLAGATFDLLERGASGLFHASNSGETTWYEFAKTAIAEFGGSATVDPVTSDQWQQIRPSSAKRPKNSRLNLAKLQQTIGREMRPWQDALSAYHRQVQEDALA